MEHFTQHSTLNYNSLSQIQAGAVRRFNKKKSMGYYLKFYGMWWVNASSFYLVKTF